MEVVRHWRMGPQRLRFTGFKKETPEGKQFLSLSGSTWIEISKNGRKREDIQQERVIYKSKPIKHISLEKTLEFSAAGD